MVWMIVSFSEPGVESVSKAELLMAALKNVKTRQYCLLCSFSVANQSLYFCEG